MENLLTKEQEQRYARQIMLPEIGTAGQMKLMGSKVLIIGAGGLGSPVSMYLAAAGVGTLCIADDDCVELSNLQRQILHGDADLGREKVASAADTLRRINGGTEVRTVRCRASPENLPELIQGYDFVLECTDNFASKFAVNDACVRAGIPFSHAGIDGFCAQLMTWVPNSPCLRCIFRNPPEPPAGKIPVLGAVAGLTGCLQAAECTKYLTGAGELLAGYLLTADIRTMQFRKIKLPAASPECPACGKIHP